MKKINTFLVIILSILVLSCAAPKKYLGSKQPLYSAYACKYETIPCSFSWEKDDWTVDGSYYLNKIGDGTFSIAGSAKLDVSEMSPVLQKIEKFWLTFIFLQGDLVVYEDRISLQGKANTYIKFSQIIETEENFESSSFISISWVVKGLEVF